jgi:hypothetical protein
MNGLYLRVGEWGKVSINHAEGRAEAGVSVYDLVEGRPVVSQVATDTAFAELDLAERMASSEPKYLVRGDLMGVGHDGEPLLANLVKVAAVEACPECGGLEVKSVEGLHVRHVGHALYPAFRYPVPSVEHGLAALSAIKGMDASQEVSVKTALAPFATEVMAAYSKHMEEHRHRYERVLDVGSMLERKVGEAWQEWRHRHSHDSIEVGELERLASPEREDKHGLEALLMS